MRLPPERGEDAINGGQRSEQTSTSAASHRDGIRRVTPCAQSVQQLCSPLRADERSDRHERETGHPRGKRRSLAVE